MVSELVVESLKTEHMLIDDCLFAAQTLFDD
jgi:hypothetical protein